MDDWIVCGNFNLVRSSFKKQGGNLIDNNLANLISNTIDDCNLNDVGF